MGKPILQSLLFLCFLGISFFSFVFPSFAIQTPVVKKSEVIEVVVFVRDSCAHCRSEQAFLTELEKKRPELKVTRYHLENEKDKRVWEAFTNHIQSSKVTPITVIGDHYLIGFDSDKTTGEEIISLIDVAQTTNAKTDLKNPTLIMGGKTSTCVENPTVPCTDKPKSELTVPLLGKIDTKTYPLIALSAILGFLDGFNPCAMWVLVTFLIILLQIGDRRKMFLFAGTFILAEAVMYTLILTVWFKTWDFVQMDSIVTPLVGLVAIGGGLFFLYEYRKKELACQVTNLKQRSQIKKRIEDLAINKFTLLTFIGVLGIAFSVNIIEFACSIGIPQSFTKILELNNLSLLQSAWYIFIYILFYMVDDLVVFGIALYGAEKLSITAKYTRYSNLVGGIIMILLGILLLLRPSLLLF